MNGTRMDRLLHQWDAVAGQAVRPAMAPRPATIRRQSVGGFGLLPLAAGALAVALAVAWLGGHEDRGVGNGRASASPNASRSTAPASPPASEPAPTPSEQLPAGAAAPCEPERLAVAITGWDGAAGSRTAALTLGVTGADRCTIDRLWRPELVDGVGRIRLEGGVVRDTGTIQVRPGEALTTLVQASNDCAPPPVSPVTIAFVLGDGSRVVAAPPSPTDVTTPPCNGPGQPGTISMQPWSR